MSTLQAAPTTDVRVPRLVRFAVVGALTAALDLVVLVLGREVLGLPLAVAALAGWACGTAANFAANRRWTFGITGGSRTADSARYGVLVVANLLAAVVAVPLLAAAGMPYPLARVATLLAMLIANFLACRTWVFRG